MNVFCAVLERANDYHFVCHLYIHCSYHNQQSYHWPNCQVRDNFCYFYFYFLVLQAVFDLYKF
jgi:hypothetical protein